jgi:hypothetical protein
VVLEGRLLRADHRRGHYDTSPVRRVDPDTAIDDAHVPNNGAAARVPEDATAFAYRNGGWVCVTAGIDPDPANLPAAASWAQQYWQELHASSAGGGYVNMMMEDDGRERYAPPIAAISTG